MKKINNISKKIIDFIYHRVFISSDFVKEPSTSEFGISDLFVWRSDNDWSTYFELLDVYGLITCDLNSSPQRYVVAVFFDKDGEKLLEKKINLNENARNTIAVSDFLTKEEVESYGDFGTFAIFHSIDNKLGNDVVLTDRGYCGYEFKNSHFRGYVHGNFDAIENSPDETKLLMGFNKISRSYNLQHILTGPSTYDIALVNPTEVSQVVKIVAKGNCNKNSYNKKIKPRGVEIFTFHLEEGQYLRLQIKSKMYMARPSVFRYKENSMDVFHG